MAHIGFFDWNNKYQEADVVVVDKNEINPICDTHVASVEMTDGSYFEIYSVDGELHGYLDEA